MAILTLDHITVRFGGLTAVSDLSFEVEQGEIVGLIGPNGAGKTTVFNTITGVYRPTHGRVSFNGEDITALRPDLITSRGIARTFQNIRLFSDLSVLDNVMVGHYVHMRSSTLATILGLPTYRREEQAAYQESLRLLQAVGLGAPELALRKPSHLPYGLQRRVEISRALATKPQLLLMDEPAAGMTPEEGRELIAFVRRIPSDFGVSVLLVEHTMPVVMGCCPRIIVLDYGKAIAEGSPQEIQSNQTVIEAYLGEAESVEC